MSIVLEGKKVRLRPKDWRDVQHDYEWSRDQELVRLDATWPTTLTLAEYIAGYGDELCCPSQGRFRSAIETLEGRHIGNCMYYDLNETQGQTELGILIGDRDYWDNGYGTEAVSLLLDHIFGTTSVNRVYLHTLEWNVRAQRSFQKCGFISQGIKLRNGQPFVLMDITRSQWEALRSLNQKLSISSETSAREVSYPGCQPQEARRCVEKGPS